MKFKAVLLVLVALGLSACGDIQPTKSPCFQPGGSVACKFTPLPELNRTGG
ncbi:MAG: hypothetical protein ORO03_05950 [Alphaproteobacteria bacterium]|nr:hypothetical protein [Alphaproteobacteria bacterium]